MTKHEIINAIIQLQTDKGCVVQTYDELLNPKGHIRSEGSLEEQFINLSPSAMMLDYDNAKKIYDSLQSGGASYSPATKVLNPDTGCMVSLIGYEKRIDPVNRVSLLKHAINLWMAEIGFTNDPRWWNEWNAYIGLWMNHEILVIDISQNIKDRDIAIALGHARKQVCIWDCVNKCEIQMIYNS